MFATFANIFGYILNFIYQFFGNFGVSIIIFCIVLKFIMLPLSIKQQKTMKKTSKIQEKMKQLQFKYKNDPEMLNQEVMKLYKDEHMSPFSGCLSSIIQIIILLSVFYLVSRPLTYMKNLDDFYVQKDSSLETVQNMDINENLEKNDNTISLIDYYIEQINKNEDMNLGNYQEISVIQYFGQSDNKINLNMNFLGLDLSKVLTQSMNDWRVYIIPLLYVISSIISLKVTTATQAKLKSKNSDIIEAEVIKNNDEPKNEDEGVKALTDPQNTDKQQDDPMEQANKSMSLFMPIMSLSIAIIAPLGLALYWLMNNMLMIIERLVLNKLFDKEEEN